MRHPSDGREHADQRRRRTLGASAGADVGADSLLELAGAASLEARDGHFWTCLRQPADRARMDSNKLDVSDALQNQG